jgi:hypothetical protein
MSFLLTRAGLVLVLLGSVALRAQIQPIQVPTCSGSVPVTVVPGNVAANPTLSVVDAWVDPQSGNNATATVGGGAFKTIQAAANALALALLPGQHGRVQLLAGRYGTGTGTTSFAQGNGELWPVNVPANVSIVGVNALNTCLDLSLFAASSSTVSLPHPRTGVVGPRRVALIYEGAGHDQSAVARITIVNADVGILVRGTVPANPTLTNLCICQCDVAVCVYSNDPPTSGLHRPRVVNCTLADNTVGVAAMNQGSAVMSAPRGRPAIVNTILKNDFDFEGISCSGVFASAFSAALSNTSTAMMQSAESATPVFDTAAWSAADLFLGVQLWPSSAGTPQPTDWRLAPRTQGGALNPARAAGTGIFPILLSNGTLIDIYLPGFAVGSGATGGGSAVQPFAAVWDLGYEPLQPFTVGGCMPLTDAFGHSLTGSPSPFTVMHLFSDDASSINLLFAVLPPLGTPRYLPGESLPAGMSDNLSAMTLGNPIWLDLDLGLVNVTSLLGAPFGSTSSGVLHASIAWNTSALPGELQLALQLVRITTLGQIEICNAARCSLTPGF